MRHRAAQRRVVSAWRLRWSTRRPQFLCCAATSTTAALAGVKCGNTVYCHASQRERIGMPSPHGGSRLGTRFGPYELNSLIGVGGMGEVYRAYDTSKDRTVAVKLLRAEMAADPGFQERFRRESRMAARLQEPHVIPVHDFGDIDGVLYIDMRLVEGASLKDELLANGAIDPNRAASIIGQVAAAL